MRRLLILLLLLSPLAFAGDAIVIRNFTFGHSGYVDVNHGGTATMWIDFSQDPSGATITTSDGGYTLTKEGAPARVNDGTWPAGLSGTQGYSHSFDGSNDYYTRADDDTFDPAGDFSVQCAFVPESVSGFHVLLSKFNGATGQRSWALYTTNDGVAVLVSDDGTADGGHISYATKTSALAQNRPALVTATYDYVADGSSVCKIYVDGLAVYTKSDMDGPAYNSTAALALGAYGNGASKFQGPIGHCKYVGGTVLTESDHMFSWRQYQGRMSPTTNIASVASAAPPAVVMAPPDSGTEPFLAPPAAGSVHIGSLSSGSGGAYGAPAITNLAYRSKICETQDGSNHPQGWSVVETAGDGTAAADCSQTTVADGLWSLKAVLTGTTSFASARTECITTGIASDIYFSAYQKCTSGTCQSQLRILEYDVADCTSLLADTLVVNIGAGASDWAKYGGKFAAGSWDAASSAYKVYVIENCDGGCTSYFDSPMLRVASQPTDVFCGSDADAAAVCNMLDVTSDSEALSAASWTITATVRSPIDGAEATPVRTILRVPATAGNNNKITASWASDTLTLSVYDSAGAEKTSTVAAAGNANTDYDIMLKKSFDGNIWACWEGTCDATPGTAALTDGVGSEIVYGSDGSTGGDIWVRDVKIYRRVLP